MKDIYCIEDDESIRELMIYALKTNDYNGVGFTDSEKFFAALNQKLPKLVLLDIMLPTEDGLSILTKIRNNPHTSKIPVIIVTAKSSEYDRVKGLDLGADDYIPKPFGVMELVSRVRAVLRRTDKDQVSDIFTVGNMVIDQPKHRVTIANEAVTLTFKEFELLHYLARNMELALSRDTLMETVWGVDFEGESRTVDMHIKSLRQKLGEHGDYIHTVRGVGYKLSASPQL